MKKKVFNRLLLWTKGINTGSLQLEWHYEKKRDKTKSREGEDKNFEYPSCICRPVALDLSYFGPIECGIRQRFNYIIRNVLVTYFTKTFDENELTSTSLLDLSSQCKSICFLSARLSLFFRLAAGHFWWGSILISFGHYMILVNWRVEIRLGC